jgi:Tail specific protease N-terminal domain
LSVDKTTSKYIKGRFFLLAIAFLISLLSFGQKDFKAESIRLKEVLEANHLAPPAIDDLFAANVFELFISKIDPDQIYLTSSDVDELSKLRNQLDEEFSGKDLKFLAKATVLLKTNLERCVQNIDQICKTPIAAKLKQPIIASFHPPKTRTASAEFLSMWQRKISYEVFQKVYGQTRLEFGTDNKESLNESFFLANEKKAREAVARSSVFSIIPLALIDTFLL